MRYRVRALRSGGELAVLEVEAGSEDAARLEAATGGLTVLSVAARARGLALPGRSGRRPAFPLLLFTQEFVALLEAGLGAAEALEALAAKDGVYGRGVGAALRHVAAGRSLSQAFEMSGGAFPPLFVATVRASERTGDMKEALTRFADYCGQVERLRARVVSAMIYPAVLAATGAAVTAFLVLYVVPRFSRIYEDLGGRLPFLSRMLMHWGQLLSEHGGTLLVSLALLAVVGLRLSSRFGLRERLARWAWRVPRVGEVLRLYHLARFYRTMGMLLRSGMPLVPALGMARDLLDDTMRPALDAASRRVGEGIAASIALADAGLTTPVGLSMLKVGEKTGELGSMMDRVASFHDEELARGVDVATRLVEPLLMAAIGLVIGVLVVLLYLPVFELANSLQ